MSDRYTFDNPISRLTQARAEQLNAEFGAIAVSFTHVYTKDEIDAKEFVTANIADAAITLGKLANLPAMQVVGNLTNASSTPVAVPVLDENALASNSPSALPTQRSVKAYADALDTAVRAFIAASDDSAAISAQAAADALSDTIDARDEAAQIVANIADADPYLASNVTFDPTSTSLTSTDVQGVVVELATDLASVDAKASIQASWTETDPASLAYIHDKPVLVAQADLDQAVADAVAGYTTPDIAFRDSGDGLTLEYETTTDPGVWRDFLDYAKITDVAVREVRAPETAVRILRERGVETAPGVTIEVEDRTEAALLTPGVAHGVRDGAGRLASATLSDGGTFVADLKADRASIDGADLAVRDGRYLSAITDPSGRVLAGWLRDGTFAAPGGQIIDYGESDYAFAYRDPAGNVAFGLRRDGTLFTPGGDSMSLLTAEMDRTAVGHATGRRTPGVTQVQRPTADYNTLVVYGQSLGVGNETWPAISRDNQAGNLTLGAAPLPANGSSDGYTPVGSSALQPLGAVTLSDSATRSALSDAAEAALPPGDQAVGEPPNHGFANGAKVRHNARLLVENDASRAFVTVNPGVGGRTIEQLSKGADHYTRYEGALSGLTTAVGASMHVIAGILWMQGEYNYATTWGGDATKAGYKAFLDTLIDDMQSDAMAATGQARPPVFLSYQTGGAYTQDADANGDPGLHVGMAQLEIATERPDAAMIGPVYPYTDKGGHLDSNGSRWFGHMAAKVWHRVVEMGEAWEPLRPLDIRRRGKAVYIAFHVPSPPLVFDTPYVVAAAADCDDKGFRVTDAAGDTVSIASVRIAEPSVVEIVCERDPGDGAHVWYADKTVHNGNGNLRDSDPTLASDPYVYEPERGMYAAANIPALVGIPYPLHNWCVAFYLPIGDA